MLNKQIKQTLFTFKQLATNGGKERLTELERLAEIGLATEKAFKDGFYMEKEIEDGKGRYYGKTKHLLYLHDLLEWAKKEE